MSEYISNSMDICEEKTTSLSNFRHEGPDHGDHYDRGAWHTDPEREEIVKPFINSILTDHEVFSYVENVLYPNGVVPANDVRRKGRKGVLARVTRPVSRLNALDVVFAACRDASFVTFCLSSYMNMFHGDLNPSSVHAFRCHKGNPRGMVYDFDHYTAKSILSRAANPGQPMGQGRCPWAGTTIEKYVEDEKKRKEREKAIDTEKEKGEGGGNDGMKEKEMVNGGGETEQVGNNEKQEPESESGDQNKMEIDEEKPT